MPNGSAWGDTEDAILRKHPHQRKAAQRALRAAGHHRSYTAVCQRAHALGFANLPRPKAKRRPKHTPGAGRTRAQNAALWRLAERRPTPSEYQRERARIL